MGERSARRSRERALKVGLALVAAILVPCAASAHTQVPAEATTSAPESVEVLDAPQRYVDPVFADVSVTAGIGFATVTDVLGHQQRLRLDLYEPTGDTAPARPVVVWVHGGSFQRGDRSLMRWWAEEFARRGYVTASVDYRLEPADDVHWGRGIMNALEDARAAVRWLRAQATEHRLDDSRISMGGISAGAVTSLQAAYAVVAPGGPNAGYSSRISAAISLSGASTAQPNAGEAPAIMFHGSADAVVGYDQTITPGQGFDAVHTCQRIRAGGVDCLFHTHQGAGHDLTAYDDEDRDAALQFLSCRVGAPSPFTDTAGRRYEHAAGWAVRSSLLGAGPRRFRGADPLTRAEADAAVWSLLDRPTAGPPVPARPADPVSRGRLVTLLWNAAGAPAGAPDADYADVGTGALADAADWAAAHGVLRGTGTRFSPSAPVDRGRAAVGLHRLAMTASAWTPALQAAPPSTVCFRVGDPAALG